MKKILFVIGILFIVSTNAQTLKGGVSEEYIPNGFFGSWGVISKLQSSNNPSLFSSESRDIWTLSGYDNILILQNLESGARSEITIKDKNKDGKHLKFERQKVVKKDSNKTIYKEIVSFELFGDNFSGYDNFIVEEYKNNELLKQNKATYVVKGVKISGNNPN